MKTSEDYLKQMQSLAAMSDNAKAHQKADDLLCTIIRSLARGRRDRPQLEAVVQVFQSIQRWYE